MSKKFTPPAFGKFGKNVKDLFKKKYDFDHQVKLVNKAAGGVTIESGAHIAESAPVKGYVKGKYAAAEWGESELELWTAETNESKVTVKLTKLYDGLNVTLAGSSKDKDAAFKSSVASVDIEYSQENLALQDVVKTDFTTTKVESTVAVGTDGLSVAAQAVADVTAGFKVTDYNFAAEYAAKDLTASVFTEKSASVVSAGLYQKPNASQVFGAIFKYDFTKKSRTLQLGAEHRVDADTTVRGKVDLPDATVSAVVEHKLANPAILLQVAAQFASKPTITTQKLGVSASFGDF